MISRIERLLIALLFALLAAGLTLVFASAQGENPPAAQTSSLECVSCHTESQATWQTGAHGKAELVTCEACHGSAPADHPKTPMSIDRSPDLCIRCHSNTSFGVEDWKASKHSELGIDCATCHDPHSASLKKIVGPRGAPSNTDDSSALCINCHKDHSLDFSYSTHSQQGLACADCHVNHVENADGTTNTVTNHTFAASLASCSNCHAEQMHSNAEAKISEEGAASVLGEQTTEAHLAAASSEPQPVGPMGFSALAGMIGLAGGMVLAPWLERWFYRSVKQNQEDDNE
jgi:predicted CXXCH cytochrome family protein